MSRSGEETPLIVPTTTTNDDDTWGLQTETTSDLLASFEWQMANPVNYGGLVHRLEMMRDHGLPPMRVVSAETLQRLGRIPRSTDVDEDEDEDGGRRHVVEDALDVVMRKGTSAANFPNAIILFFSHRWLRPNHCKEERMDLIWGTEERKNAMEKGYVVGYPDSGDDEKATALVHYARWLRAQMLRSNVAFPYFPISDDLEVFYWIDFCCVDQTNPGPDMKALPAYVAVSAGILSYFSEGYKDRAWCRVELMLAHSFMASGNNVYVLPQNFRYEGHQQGIDDPPLGRAFSFPDPLEGNITNNDDWAIVRTLRQVASESTIFTCWRVYVNHSLASAFWCFWWNILCCCMWCGLCALESSRSVKPGEGRGRKIIPRPYAHLG